MSPPALSELPPPPPGKTGWPWTESSPWLPAVMPGGEPWPRLSLVTPSFNQGSSLEESIRSVLLQGYPNLEYFVIDGGSTDGSLDILRRYAPWLTAWVSEPDRGQSHAINKGLERASGEIAAWLNSDDVYPPGTFRLVAEAFAGHAEAAVIYGNAHLIDRAGAFAADSYAAPYDRRLLLNQANPIPQPSAFFRRSAVQAAGGLDESLHFAMDYDLWLRLDTQGPLIFVPAVWSKMRIYPGAKTKSGDQRLFAEVRQVSLRHGGQGLPAGYEDWLVSTHLPRAFGAFLRGEDEAGQQELSFVLEYVPAWRSDVARLSQEIAGRAWRLAPGLTGDDRVAIEFADRVCRHLPSAVASPAGVRRQVMARLYEAAAFRNYRRGDAQAVIRQARQAVQHDPARLRNRGLWSIALRSALGLRPDGAAQNSPLNGEGLLRQMVEAVAASDPFSRPAPEGAEASTLTRTCSAVSILGLLGRLETLDLPRYRAALLAHQDPASGLFLDNGLPRQGGSAPRNDSSVCAWQVTEGALEALDRLGAGPVHPLSFVQACRSPAAVREWLSGLDWSQPEWLTSLNWQHPRLASSARVMRLAAFLIHEGERTGAEDYPKAANSVLDWLDERQDPDTGFWVLGRSMSEVSPMVSVGHFAHLYFYLGRPVRYAERIIDSTLGLQQLDGLFEPLGESACADLTGVDLLVKFSLLTGHRAEVVKTALHYAFHAIYARRFDGDLESTRLRLLALALISSRYPGEFIEGISWQFCRTCTFGWHDPGQMRDLGKAFYS